VSGQNSTGQVDQYTTFRNPSLAHKHDSAGSVIENEPAELCLYVSGVLRKVVLVDLPGTISLTFDLHDTQIWWKSKTYKATHGLLDRIDHSPR
jgi:hypothetical protein